METRKKEQLLKSIIDLEAKASNLNVIISDKCQEYCDLYSEYERGDNIRVFTKKDVFVYHAVIKNIKFDGHGFYYVVMPVKNDGSRNKRYHAHQGISSRSPLKIISN